PVVAAFLLAAPVLLLELRAGSTGRLDAASLLLPLAGLLLSTYALNSAAGAGLGLPQLVAGSAGATGLAQVLLRQRRIPLPLLDLSLFKDPVFSIAILAGLLSLVVWSAAGYLSGMYLQSVLGLDVFDAALLTLPGAAVLTATCVGTSRIVERIGRKRALVATHALIGAGLLPMLLTTVDSGAVAFVASTLLAGVGYGLSFSLVAEIAVSAVPAERAGAAGSIAETSNEIGNALAITLRGSLATLVFRLQGPGLASTLNETLSLAGLEASAAIQAKQAFVAGMHLAVGAGAALALLAAVAAWRWLPD